MFFGENELSIELLGVFKIKRKSYSHKSFDNRGYDSLSIRTQGSGKFKTNSKSLTVKKGDVLYIPKNAEYLQSTVEESVIAVHFINYSYKGKGKIEYRSVEDTEYVEGLFKKMYDTWKEKKQGYRYLCMSLLYELLYYLNCRESDKMIDSLSHEGKMNAAIDYIHSNYRNGTIKISYLAKLSAVSEAYFRKLFKKIHGVSPQQYIINLKLEFASHLLGSKLYTVSEVSQKSGFSDTKYFSRAFKTHFGVSPKNYNDNRM